MATETKEEARALEHSELEYGFDFIYPLNLQGNKQLRLIKGGLEYLRILSEFRKKRIIISGHNYVRDGLSKADWLNPVIKQQLIMQLPR